MKRTVRWSGCYDDSWKGVITAASFAHPAKFAKGLVERILDYLVAQKLIEPGAAIGDPFGGVGPGGIVAAYRGFRWIGNELEAKFVRVAVGHDCPGLSKEEWVRWYGRFGRHPQLCPNCIASAHLIDDSAYWNREDGRKQVIFQPIPSIAPHYFQGNFDLHRDRWARLGVPAPIMSCGDSRYFDLIVDAILTSPPYSGSLDDGGPEKRHPDGYKRSNNWTGYGTSDGQIAKLKEGKIDSVIASPPYLGARSDTTSSAGGIAVNGYEGKEPGERTFQSGRGDHRMGGNIETAPAGQVDAVLASPPYDVISAGAGGLNTKPAKKEGQQSGRKTGVSQTTDQQYGETPGQIARTKKGPVDVVLTSPPYEDSINSKSHGIDFSKAKKDYPGRVESPERVANHCRRAEAMIYGNTRGQIGKLKKETYWEAMKRVYCACYRVLRDGGVMAIVVKDFVKNKKRCYLCDDTMRLLKHIGFEPVQRIHAMLVEEHVAPDLFEGSVTQRTEKKSFFRRLHESKLPKDDPRRIDYEEVLIVRKPDRVEPEYEDLGFLSAAPPERSISLRCEPCKVRWTGCQDAYQCPRCGSDEAWREYMKMGDLFIK